MTSTLRFLAALTGLAITSTSVNAGYITGKMPETPAIDIQPILQQWLAEDRDPFRVPLHAPIPSLAFALQTPGQPGTDIFQNLPELKEPSVPVLPDMPHVRPEWGPKERSPFRTGSPHVAPFPPDGPPAKWDIEREEEEGTNACIGIFLLCLLVFTAAIAIGLAAHRR